MWGNDMNTDKIRQLNDAFRRSFIGGQVLLTQGIRALPEQDVVDIMIKVQRFHDFNRKNDPYQEHDFGKIEYKGINIFWKIDYYDKDNRFRSPDPSNPNRTNRVMTIMRSDEY